MNARLDLGVLTLVVTCSLVFLLEGRKLETFGPNCTGLQWDELPNSWFCWYLSWLAMPREICHVLINTSFGLPLAYDEQISNRQLGMFRSLGRQNCWTAIGLWLAPDVIGTSPDSLKWWRNPNTPSDHSWKVTRPSEKDSNDNGKWPS